MTERWRKKLEGIDGLGPSDDVYQRAKSGPNLPEPQSPMQRTSTRVVTAIAAFVVFALGISVFAIPALRLHEGAAPLSAGSQLLPLWPARTLDQVHDLQAQADSGTAAWALDPRQVATRFGQTVLGWPDASAQIPSGTQVDPTCGVAPGDYPMSASPIIACAYEGTGGALASDVGSSGPSAGACGSQMLLCGGSTSGPSSPFVTFEVNPCYSPSCDQVFGPVSVELFQPGGSGEGQVWGVFEVRSPYVDLALTPGQTVREGSSVSTGIRLPIGQHFGFGMHIGGTDSCDVNLATDVYHAPFSPNDLVTAAGSELGTDVGPRSATTCEADEPGYVFVATSGKAIVQDGAAFDPLQGEAGALSSFAAVPILFEWPDGPVGSTPPPTAPVAWTTYTDHLGWTIDVPSDWGITDATDELIVSAPGGDPYVQINRVPNDPPRDDSSFPLDYSAMANDPQAHFRGDGQAFIIQWLTGDGSATTPEQAAEFDRITRSIAFPATQLGVTEGGWTAVGPILQSASAEWVTYKLTGDHYIAALTGGGARTAFGPAPTCSGGGGSYEVRETGVAGITCSDGTGGDWDFTTGEPKAGNSAGFDLPLHDWPAVRSWDGWLLVQLPIGPTPTPSPP